MTSKGCGLRASMLLAALLLVASAVTADTTTQKIIVRSDAMDTWLTATQGDSGCKWRLQDAALGGPEPYGAFYAATGWTGDDTTTPGQVFLGTDHYSGIRIADITKLSYSTFTFPTGWDPADYTHRSKQPFQLQIAIRRGGPTSPNWSWLMHRPWGTMSDPSGHLYDSGLRVYSQWQTFDAYNAGASQVNGVWYDGWTGMTFANWDAIVAQWPDAVLSTPATGFAWFPSGSLPYTGTGTSVNLEVGARLTGTNLFNLSSYAWWQESIDFSGYVDNFTIGVKDTQGNITETNYDFEGQLKPTVAINSKAATDPLTATARSNFRFVVWGKVDDMSYDATGFTITDGTGGNPIRVTAAGYTTTGRPYVRVAGDLRPAVTPPTIYSSPEMITVLYEE